MGARQVNQNGGAQRANAVHNVHHRAGRVGCDVSHGIDAISWTAQSFRVGDDVAALVEPGCREERRVGAAAGGVDIDVYSLGDVVGQLQSCF